LTARAAAELWRAAGGRLSRRRVRPLSAEAAPTLDAAVERVAQHR